MKQIIGQSQIQPCCVKLLCGTDQGTAFFISKSLLVTAYHVILENIDNGVPATFMLDGKTVSCTVVATDQNLDLCILKSDTEGPATLPVLSATIRVGEHCELCGFPYKLESNFLIYSGLIAQLLLNERSDFKVSADELNRDFDYEGFSGGPVITGSYVTGIALKQVDNSITGISITKAKSFLVQNGIQVEDEYLYHQVPKEFQNSLKGTSPNYRAIEALDTALTSKGSWVVLQGSPGSGKTTLAASYSPREDAHVIFGRYFLKVPNDSRPATLRTSSEFFFDTIENLLSSVVSGEPLSRKEITFEKRHERFLGLIEQVNSHFQSKSQVGIFVIDGIDETSSATEFLAPIPTDLGANLKIVVSCTSLDKIPIRISTQLQEGNAINVTPLEMVQCEALIRTELQEFNLPIDAIQKLAVKSEGHPLYLRYLINFYKFNPPINTDEIEKWIENMPVISGDIKRYYESIWASIYADANKLWILILLSNLRQSVDKDTIYAILPEQIQLGFSAGYPAIRFLLGDEDQIQLYHNSFKEFVLDKTKVDTRKANDLIAEYCTRFNNTELAYNNVVFHLCRGSEPLKAVNACSQLWADKCAINDVAPDLVINDIKLCLALSLNTKNTSEVIRLLLLLQRISFRYDSVLKENATYLAQALISMGKYSSALKYVVRDNTLLVSNDDAIFFLQQFYEDEALNEAAVLLEAIDRKYRKVLQEGFESEEGLDSRILILKLNSLALYLNDDWWDAARQWVYFQTKYQKMHEMAAEDSQVNSLREHCAAWQVAYVLRRFDRYNNHQKVAKVSKLQTTERHATILATTSLIFDQLNTYNSIGAKKTERFYELITDLEDVIVNVGYSKSPDDLYKIARALTGNSRNEVLTQRIATEYLAIPFDFGLRKENGVDLNYPSVHRLLFVNRCQGYIDTSNTYPNFVCRSPRYKHWEQFATGMLKLLGFIEGKLLRLRANGTDDKTEIDNNLEALINGFRLTLDERSYWDRSYLIPEGIFPLIISALFDIVNEHRPNRLSDVVQLLSTHTSQFGLYTEGFRSCLFEAVTSCIRHGAAKASFMPLIDIWRSHVLHVENRWERTQELLKITEVYGLINETAKALEVFQDMLNTSMGPTWYKESQLSLINESLKLKPNVSTTEKYLQRFAGTLDFASGEMTFQRYVRNEKESFVGSLSRVKNLASAIEYFKFEVIPPANILILNAESKTIDSPRVGDGYALGAANIAEPAAVRSIISNGKSPYVRWFLANIYIVNDDTYRYLQDYATIHAKCLNDLQHDQVFLKDAAVQLNELLKSEEIQEDRNLYEYVQPLYNQANLEIRKWLEENIKIEIQWDRMSEEENKTATPDDPNEFDAFNAAVASQLIDHSEILSKGFTTFKESRINIWYRNWSTASNATRTILRENIRSSEEALEYLAPFIGEYSDEYWSIAAEVLWFTRDVLNENQKEEIIQRISEHFELIVRPDDATAQKYGWLGQANPQAAETPDNLLVQLMIWLLNHPVDSIRSKAYAALVNLSVYELDTVFSQVTSEISKNLPRRSTEASSHILKKISEKEPSRIISLFKDRVIGELKDVNHFSIRKNLLDLGAELAKHGFNDLLQAVEQIIPTSVNLASDVAFEEDIFEPIQHYIDELNDEQFLNRVFCESMITMATEFSQPLLPVAFEKSDRYLQRSFYVDDNEGVYYHMLKHCLNVAISPQIERSRYEEVFDILN